MVEIGWSSLLADRAVGPAPRWDRRDTVCVVVLAVLAALPRFWMFGRLGINHFDEGGYAMSARALALNELPEGLYPLQHFLSPPLFPSLAGLGMKLLGANADWVLLGLSAVIGVATVPLMFLFGRRWFSREAGLAAGVLFALSDFHIVMSRIGLTDVMFTFFFVLALWAFAEAEERQSWTFAALAGVATGLAWNVKYHGWLAGVIAAAALAPAVLRGDFRRAVAGLGRIAFAAVIALLLYAPWVLWVASTESGYSGLLAEHARFLQPARALQSALRHAQMQLYLDGWSSRIAPAVSFIGAALLAGGRSAFRRRPVALAAAVLLASGCLIGLVATVALLAAAGLWLVARSAGHGRWIVLALLAAFTILTPLYHPYARLLLPALAGAMLVAGVTMAALAGRLASAQPVRSPAGVTALTAVIAGLALVLGLRREALTTYRSSRGMANAAERLAQLVPRDAEVTVLGEPAIVFYLRARGIRAWHYDRPRGLISGRYSAGDTIYVAGGIYSRRARGLERIAVQFAGGIDSVATIPITEVNHVRLLDDFAPARARSFLRTELTAPTDRYHLEVFRVIVPDSGAANSSR
jgi:4-amino-4-deoxy-L-arabinose transferase-like glycosyltransferase